MTPPAIQIATIALCWPAASGLAPPRASHQSVEGVGFGARWCEIAIQVCRLGLPDGLVTQNGDFENAWPLSMADLDPVADLQLAMRLRRSPVHLNPSE